MARPPSTPHIGWPLKALAIVAIAGGVFAGARELSQDDEESMAVRRTGSVEADAGGLPAMPRPFPSAYSITSRVSVPGSTSTDVQRVVAPFDARTETFAGKDARGAPIAEREVSFGILATRSRGATLTVLEAPPAIAGNRLAEALRSSEGLGLVEKREVRSVAGRRCQIWRTGSEFAATTFVAPHKDSYLDLCVDGDGLLLEEWQVDGGEPVRHEVAVKVEMEDIAPDDVRRLARDITLPVSEGGGSVRKIGDQERPVGPFLEVAAPPEGFTLQGRYSVVPPHPGLREGGDRGKVRAATVDVYVRATDVIAVERGGVLDLSDPWSIDPRFPSVDLGPTIGAGELVPGRLGSEVRALLGSGRYLRIFGTVALQDLVDLARLLVPIDGGSGIGFED